MDPTSYSPYNSTDPCYGLTIRECEAHQTPWKYRPSLALNGLLIGVFGTSLIAHLIQGISWRTWGFFIAMTLGCVFEVVGYLGRIMAHSDLTGENPFLIQICCLTFAPAFFAAGIYLCLKRIVIVFGADISRIPPKWYTYLFIGCDFFSLVLQGTGGGMASTASHAHKSAQPGTNVMLAGLGFQVFTLVVFIALCSEYAFRVSQRIKSGGQLDPVHAKLRQSKRFRAFLCALALSTICILIRSIFRVIEMAQGWDGELAGDQTLFFVLEGVMVVVAVVVLNVFHPGWCFADGYGVSSTGFKSGQGSDVEFANTNKEQPAMTNPYRSS